MSESSRAPRAAHHRYSVLSLLIISSLAHIDCAHGNGQNLRNRYFSVRVPREACAKKREDLPSDIIEYVVHEGRCTGPIIDVISVVSIDKDYSTAPRPDDVEVKRVTTARGVVREEREWKNRDGTFGREIRIQADDSMVWAHYNALVGSQKDLADSILDSMDKGTE